MIHTKKYMNNQTAKELSVQWIRRLKFRHLEMLVVLGRTGSFGRAAALCGLSQPALSKWVKDLEQSLGVILFERSTRRMSLSEDGALVMRHAERVLADMARLHGQLEARREGKAGRLHVGLLAALAPVVMPEVLARVQESGWAIDVQTVEDTMDRMVPLLHERRLDLIIGRLGSREYASGLNHRLLFEDRLCVAAPTTHPLARRRRPVSWADACAYPWIIPPAESPLRGMFEHTLAHERLPPPRVALESASVLTNYHVARRLGCLFATSERVVALFAEQGLLRRIPLSFAAAPNAIAMLWSGEATPLLERFMALIEKEVGADPGARG